MSRPAMLVSNDHQDGVRIAVGVAGCPALTAQQGSRNLQRSRGKAVATKWCMPFESVASAAGLTVHLALFVDDSRVSVRTSHCEGFPAPGGSTVPWKSAASY